MSGFRHVLRRHRTGWRCSCTLKFWTDSLAEKHAHDVRGRIEMGGSACSKFRKKPIEIEAMKWPGEEGTDFDWWLTKEDHRNVGLTFAVLGVTSALFDACLGSVLGVLAGAAAAAAGAWLMCDESERAS